MHRGIETLIIGALLGCAGERGDGRDWTTTRSTARDTTVVRTTGGSAASGARTLVQELAIGSVDAPEPQYSFGQITDLDVGAGGEIYAADQMAAALRAYDSTGRFVRTIGRKGGGPGEYERVNGMVVLPNGNVAVSDYRRMTIFSASGEVVTSWRTYTGDGGSIGGVLMTDTAGLIYTEDVIGRRPARGATPRRMDDEEGRSGVIRWRPDGSRADSLEPPIERWQGARLTAERPGIRESRSIPFAPTTTWTWSPLAYFVSANTGQYAITLHRTEGPLRIERDLPPVPIESDERANHEESVTEGMRRLDPTWRWNGPPIPETKPFISGLRVGHDGRVWVSVAQPSVRLTDAEGAALAPNEEWGEGVAIGTTAFTVRPGESPGDFLRSRPTVEPRWRAPVAYDVFDPDGTFLGRVAMPPRTTLSVMRGDHVWAITRDSLDVEQITRWQVSPPFGR